MLEATTLYNIRPISPDFCDKCASRNVDFYLERCYTLVGSRTFLSKPWGTTHAILRIVRACGQTWVALLWLFLAVLTEIALTKSARKIEGSVWK